jgi:small subunit ribosomal protein S4
MQMAEKQKARFTYLLSEKQFSNYVKKAIATKGNTVAHLYTLLEKRLDNVIYRMGFANTRSAARQMTGHGHITVNGKRVTIPSIQVSEGDVIGIRVGSVNKPLFGTLSEKIKNSTTPAWIKLDTDKKQATIAGIPNHEADKAGLMFDLSVVIEFYSR